MKYLLFYIAVVLSLTAGLIYGNNQAEKELREAHYDYINNVCWQ